MAKHFILRWRREYFELEKAYADGISFMKRMKIKGKIGDKFIILLCGGGGVEYVGEIMGENTEYFDRDVYETEEGVEVLGEKVVRGCLVRIVEKVPFIPTDDVKRHINIKGPWTEKKIERELFQIILHR